MLQSSVNPALLDVSPFQIRPAIFELGHKETTMIEIAFRPSELGQVNHEVLLLCDNCHMRQFNIIGMYSVLFFHASLLVLYAQPFIVLAETKYLRKIAWRVVNRAVLLRTYVIV